MQIRKSISLAFILLTFLSLAGSFSQNDLTEANSNQTETQLIEDAENVLHEFRETVKLNIAGAVKSSVHDFALDSILLCDIDGNQSNSNLQRPFISKLSHKLFINFGALII